METVLFTVVSLIVFVGGEGSNIEDLFWCDHTEMSDQMASCEKGYLQVDVLRTSSSASYSSSFVDYEEMLIRATPSTCRQIDEYATQLMCKHAVIQDCLADDYKNLLPDRFRLAGAARYLCTNVHDLNEFCLTNYATTFGTCMLGMGFENPGETQSQTPTQRTCTRYTYAKTCVGSSFRPCGPTALKLYKTTMDFLAPMACGSWKCIPSNLVTLVITLCVIMFAKT